MRHLPVFLGILTILALSSVSTVHADVITGPGGLFRVGVNNPAGPVPGGNLYDPSANVGFQRVSDGYDPIQPGSPNNAWGVSAGPIFGVQNQGGSASSNLVQTGAPTFGPSSGTVNSILNGGSGPLLSINQSHAFAAANVLTIGVTITNISGASQAVMFSDVVDWDIAPTAFNERITADPLGSFNGITVANASRSGFENPNPLAPFGLSTGPGGGTFGPSDLGASILLDLGVLAPGQSISFDIVHALNLTGQTEAQLRAQLAALGVDFIISGVSSNGSGPTNSAALGVRTSPVPEPASMLAWGLIAGVGAVGYRLRKRQAKVVA